MKRKILIALFAFALLPLLLTATLTSNAIKKSASPLPSNDRQRKLVLPPDHPGTINGAQQPERIPDRAAYSILFRVLSNRNTEQEKQRARAYVRHVLACSKCNKTKEDDTDADAILTLVEEFNQKVKNLDSEVKRLKDTHWPQPGAQVMARLQEMQVQKDKVMDELISSLPKRLSIDGLEKIKAHIGRMKTKMKVVPSPQSPPGGPGWKPGNVHQH
jgi:hypothetical protein